MAMGESRHSEKRRRRRWGVVVRQCALFGLARRQWRHLSKGEIAVRLCNETRLSGIREGAKNTICTDAHRAEFALNA